MLYNMLQKNILKYLKNIEKYYIKIALTYIILSILT